MEAAAPPKRRLALATILVLQALQVLSFAPWLMMGALSFMAFDAPGSDQKWEPWTFVIAIWSYPLWLIAAGIVTWILFGKGRTAGAIILAAFFTLPVLAMSGVVLLTQLAG